MDFSSKDPILIRCDMQIIDDTIVCSEQVQVSKCSEQVRSVNAFMASTQNSRKRVDLVFRWFVFLNTRDKIYVFKCAPLTDGAQSTIWIWLLYKCNTKLIPQLADWMLSLIHHDFSV